MEDVNKILNDSRNHMLKAIQHTEAELTKIRAGKAMPSMLDGIKIDYYGSLMPLNQVANINTPDPKTLSIAPWEKSMAQVIEKAIKDSNLGLNPLRDGDIVRINIPPLTEERRKILVKQVKTECESGKVAIRNIRKDTNEHLRSLSKSGIPEDSLKKSESEVQKITDAHIRRIDEICLSKEKDIMTV